MKGRVTKRQKRQIFLLQFTPQMGPIARAGPVKVGAWNFLQVPHVGGRDPKLRHLVTYLPGSISRELDRK